MEAFQLFNKHRRKGHKFKVDAYNQLLHGIASCGSWLQIDLLLHSMKSQGVEPTFQTYAALIEACWKLEEKDKLEVIIPQMESNVSCCCLFITLWHLYSVSKNTECSIY